MADATAADPLPSGSNDSPNLPMVGIGMTGLILRLSNDRVVKVAKTYELDQFEGKARDDMEYINSINSQTLENERKVYERLGHHDGIIHCFQATQEGLELEFADQGNLEVYIRSYPEPRDNIKLEWISSLTDTFRYVHSRRVFVDEIALRNLLVANGRLKLADFGQSVLLPLAADTDTICENDLTAKIEILHIGWIIYSIATWTTHKYYYFDPDMHLPNLRDMHLPNLRDIPLADDLLCRAVIKKCWNGDYINMDALDKEVRALSRT